jgi:hypothetical protein
MFWRMACRLHQDIALHELAAVQFTKNQTTRSAAHEVTQHRGQRLGQIDHPPVLGIRVLCFHLVPKLSAPGFLHNLQGAEVFMDGTNVEAECFPGPHRPITREQRMQRAIRLFSSGRVAVISPQSTVGWFWSSTSGTSMNSSSQSRMKALRSSRLAPGSTEEINLATGDRLVLYTDRLVEVWRSWSGNRRHNALAR